MLATLLAGGCHGDPPGVRGDDALVVVLPRDAEQLDPRFVADPYGLKVSRLIFASLVRIDPHTLEPVPDLAQEVEQEAPDRWRVRLRSGLRFADGSALDAEDVVATFRSVVDPALGSRYRGTYERIERLEMPDRHTVVFHLDEPHAPFGTDLELPILRAEDAGRQVGLPEDPLPVGAGPYRLAARSPGHMELVANPHWHRRRPIYHRVRLLVVRDDNTRALRLLAGAGDLAVQAVPPLLVPLFEEDGDFRVRTAPGVATTYLGVNTTAGPLSDVRVRRALAHAVDRRALVRAKYGGRAKLARGWVPPGHWAYAADAPAYPYSAARARALLDAAGFSPSDAEGGARLRLVLRTGSDRFRVSVARAIAAMLRRVGIRVDVRPSEMATLVADLGKGRFELALMEVPEVTEPHVLSWFFASGRIPGRSGAGANRWRYRSAAVDAALERGRRAEDRPARREAYGIVQRQLAEDLPVIPLWHEDVVVVADDRAERFRVPRNGRLDPLAR
ncbi:MAG: ABC transporter substrate-binding protein [Myxococcota bacterium]